MQEDYVRLLALADKHARLAKEAHVLPQNATRVGNKRKHVIESDEDESAQGGDSDHAVDGQGTDAASSSTLPKKQRIATR